MQLRMQNEPVVLCLQDTTELNFNGQEIEGLGPLSYDSQGGMYLHPTYAVTPARTALGVVDAWMWAREKREIKDAQRDGPKESARWVDGYDRIAEMALEMPGTRLVYVADREADLMPPDSARETPEPSCRFAGSCRAQSLRARSRQAVGRRDL